VNCCENELRRNRCSIELCWEERALIVEADLKMSGLDESSEPVFSIWDDSWYYEVVIRSISVRLSEKTWLSEFMSRFLCWI